MNLEELTEEIRDIFLDYRTTVHADETSDGSGRRYVDYELESTDEQEKEVKELIRLWVRGFFNKLVGIKNEQGEIT